MKGSSYIPSRGDIVWLQFAPQAGHEQSGRRPAVVVSPAAYNGKVGLCLCCPITSQVKGYPFEVTLPESTQISGVVLADQLKSLDWKARGADLIGNLSVRTMKEIQARIMVLIQ